MAKKKHDARPNPLRDAIKDHRTLASSERHRRAEAANPSAKSEPSGPSGHREEAPKNVRAGAETCRTSETSRTSETPRHSETSRTSETTATAAPKDGVKASEKGASSSSRKARKRPRPKWRDFEDDGRVIVDMNVDGMPDSLTDQVLGKKRPRTPKLDEEGRPIPPPEPVELTKEERREIRRGVIKANLILLLAVLGGFGLIFFLLVTFWLQ